MSKLKLCLSSLLVAASLSTATANTTAPQAPIRLEVVELDRATVRAKLAERRKIVVQRFLAYRDAGVYPWNHIVPSTRHIWFDQQGNLCAAATLIAGDIGVDAAKKLGEKNRGIELAKVKSGPLVDWILTSGLTHHEIVAIQVPPMGASEQLRHQETQRLFSLYTDIERQLRTMEDASLELATDALMKRPELARTLLATR